MKKITTRLVRTVMLLLAFSMVVPTTVMAWYEPQRGSAERSGILDSIRPAIEAQLGGPVEFVIQSMRASDGWAFVVADPQRPGGGQISVYETSFAQDADFMDGLTVYALSAEKDGRWFHIDNVIGPTDVAFEPWPQFYGAPKEIFGF